MKEHTLDYEYADSRRYEEFYSRFDLFAATVQIWFKKEEIYGFNSSSLIRYFLEQLPARSAAQATMIQLAFSVELPVLSGTSLQKMIVPYPSFVISVPHFYSMTFQNSYRDLKDKTGCIDVAIRLRKNAVFFHQYTVCCRGTLEACQRLDEMLTPTLDYNIDRTLNLQEMKNLKTATMQKLLEDVFSFQPPHASSTSERIGEFRHNSF